MTSDAYVAFGSTGARSVRQLRGALSFTAKA
jgi:hypothetical protein